MCRHPLGIYEKALPAKTSWLEKLSIAKACGFDFVEMSVDESDERLARLDWSYAERMAIITAIQQTGIRIPSLCLSAHRRFPFGSRDQSIRERARTIMQKALQLAQDLGIRTIQLAGYDVYYEPQDNETISRFESSLAWAIQHAAAAQVMCAMETMDTPFMNSISKWKQLSDKINSPWFTVYPDIGNLSAWGNDLESELIFGGNDIAALHLKDTIAVTDKTPGKFRDVPFGEGCVDFIRLFNILQRINYRGTFLLEMWTEKSAEPLLDIINARQWIEDKMRIAGWEEDDLALPAK